MALDQGSGLVGAVAVTPANVQDVVVAPALVQAAGHGTVYADRGYDSDGLRAALSERGLGDGIMRRRRSGGRQPSLPPDTLARNHGLSLVRRAVESIFGTMKRT
jgi:IS5 family transposase